MKDQIVEIETAKLLREKGFDIGVWGSYTLYHEDNEHQHDGKSGPFGWKKGEIETSTSWFKTNSIADFSNKLYTQYPAPTQSLLQKWLREEYSFEVFVIPAHSIEDGVLVKSYRVWIPIDRNAKGGKVLLDENSVMLSFTNYEEALENGLQEALKLIE